jgi:phenylalanyl-tRNA synthetase beta chain
MKVSANWIQQYIDFDLPPTAELVTRIGAQLGAVEETVDLTAKYAQAVVVRVIACTPLENSDHLNLCYVDDGGVTPNVERREDGLVQVVCGAPNVSAGATVIWLPPGATVPSTYDTDPFVLEARTLRGAVSNGMLASAKELAIGDSHEGLWLLSAELQPGTTLLEAFQLNDQIIDIENKMFTHRPDCFGQLGVAREVAGILNQPFTSPAWYTQPSAIPAGVGLPLQVTNHIPQEAPRFMAVPIKDVTIAPSPAWLQTYLSRVGIRPINNVVDITNYIMMLTGQPTHAYDYDKVAALTDGDGAHIVVRHPQQDEQLELLSGKVVTPRAEAIMIATDTTAIGLAGVMGGGNTEVDDSTKNLILECANFDMYSIRRTSMAHGLFTDAVTRFNKGQSPLQNPAILAQLANLICQHAGGTVAGAVIDDYQDPQAQSTVSVTAEFINARLGITLAAADMAALLTNVEFTVQHDDEQLQVTAPFWRTDIAIAEDIVEEVGRLYGFNKLPLELPQRNIVPAASEPLAKLKSDIRNSLVSSGANELLTYSFVHGDLLTKAGQNKSQAYQISNALSPDLQFMRLTALPSLLDKVHPNIKAGHAAFALFEFSKGHDKNVALNDEGVPIEFEDLDFVYAAKQARDGAAYYHARRFVDTLAVDLGLPEFTFRPFSEDPHDPVTDPYDLKRSAAIWSGDTQIGIVGEFKMSVQKSFKLPSYVAGFSLNPKKLLSLERSQKYQPLSKFPRIEQDVCLRVSNELAFADLSSFVQSQLLKTKPEHVQLSIVPLDVYQKNDDTASKQITFRVSMVSNEKTMTDQEVASLLDEMAQAAKQQFQAERI